MVCGAGSAEAFVPVRSDEKRRRRAQHSVRLRLSWDGLVGARGMVNEALT